MRRLLLLALLASACAHAGGGGTPSADGGSGSIRLRFAWPQGWQSHVLVAHESRRAGSPPTGLLARQRLVVEPRGGELWIKAKDIVAEGTERDLEQLVRINEALVQVVGPDGKFRRAEGVEEALAALKPSGPEAADSSRRALARSAALDWDLLVGFWAGQELAPGEVRRGQVMAYLPEVAAVEASLDVEYGLEARVPCSDEETARKCVALSYRAELPPRARPAVLEQLRRLSASQGEKAVPEDVHATLEVLLVTEPQTLLPRRMTQREALRLRMTLPDGHVVDTETRSEDTTLFTEREVPLPRPAPAPEPDGASDKKATPL